MRPAWSASTVRPAPPTARSVCPSRQVRPAVSVTTTATLIPARAARASRSTRADRSGSAGSSTTRPGSTLEASTPAAAMVSPSRFTTIASGPRRATTRRVSRAMTSSRSPVTTRPSALLTTLLVTQTTSPSASATASVEALPSVEPVETTDLDSAPSNSSARSSPARTSPTPSGEQTVITRASPDQVERGRRHRRGGLERGHQQGGRCAGESRLAHPVDLALVDGVDEPAVEHAAGRARAVVEPDTGGRDLDADRGEHLVGHPTHVGAADDRRETDHRCAGRDQGVTDPRYAEDRADADHRVARRHQHQVGVGDRVDDAGAGRGLLEADHEDGLRRYLGLQPHPVLLEVHDPSAARSLGVRDRDVGLDAVVGHRQETDVRLPAPAERLGDLREREAGVEHLRAHQMGGEVAVAEADTGLIPAVRRQLLLGAPRLVAAAPPALGVDAVAEGV